MRPQKAPVAFLAKVIDDISDEDGWSQLGTLGQSISKLRSDFDARLYGYKKLSDLIRAHAGQFELEERGATASGGKSLYVRNRRGAR